ncbi:ADP-ribosylation factor family-domain-containing protein [Tuber indicum]|nr:ADP-ribosylation factor family-domain-containing protein [Tuber indicum]
MSKLTSYLRSLYGAPGPTGRCLITGLDASGKTALLYRMKLGEKVVTIPTIGFNCEDVPRGKDSITFWDIGGCGSIRPLIRHYMAPGHSVLFLVNTSECIRDAERYKDTIDELTAQVTGSVRGGVVFILVAFSKQDLLTEAQHIQETAVKQHVRETMDALLPVGAQKGLFSVMSAGFSSDEGSGVEELLDALMAGVKRNNVNPTIPEPGSTVEPVHKPITEHANDPYVGLAPERFFGMMESASFPLWDHRSHVRGGFYVLIKGLGSGLSLWDAVEDFLNILEKMLATDTARAQVEGTERKFRNTVHRTMTTFYLHSIYLSILKFMEFRNPPRIPEHTDFEAFIQLNTHLSSSLWTIYYSRDLMFSPPAKESWRLPDLKPLPTYFRSSGQMPLFPSSHIPSDLNKHYKIFALSTLKRTKTTKSRRGKVIADALEALNHHIIRWRVRDPTVGPYSTTKAYFYIQIFHAAIEGLGTSVDITRLSYDAFALAFPDLVQGNIWREYYKEKVWESIQARAEFVPPGIKPLPNIIPLVDITAAAAREVHNQAAGKVIADDIELMLAEHWVLSDMQDLSLMLRSHGGMIWWYFSALWAVIRSQSSSHISSSPSPNTAAPTSSSLGAATRLLVKDELLRNESPRGVTEKTFWAQVMLQRIAGFKITVRDGLWDRNICLADARRFLAENREIVDENLWMEYYSAESWWSADAAAMFLPPDLKDLGGVVPGDDRNDNSRE